MAHERFDDDELASRREACWRLVLLLLMVSVACQPYSGCDSHTSTTPTPPADCGGLSSEFDSKIGPGGEGVQLTVGQSRRVTLWPLLPAECVGGLTSVWSLRSEEIASVATDGLPANSAWITGLSRGATWASVQIRFIDGVEKQTPDAVVLVDPPETPLAASVVVAEGEVFLDPIPPNNASPESRRFIPFETTVRGRVDALVDWGSPLNKVDYAGFEGECSSVGTCGRLVLTVRATAVKPLPASASELAAGKYTLRIDNLGPAREAVAYIVHLTPS